MGKEKRRDVLFHVLCTWNEEQLRMLLRIMVDHTRARALLYPDLHPVTSAWMRMPPPLGDMLWIDAMDCVARCAFKGVLWPRVLLLAALPQSYGALELLATDSTFVLEELDALPLVNIPGLMALINAELGAWCNRDWAGPDLFVDRVRDGYIEGVQ